MGQVALPWAELKAYNDCTGNVLDIWDLKQLSLMSKVFCSGLSEFAKQCNTPYQREWSEEDRQGLVQAQMDAIDGAMEEVEKPL